MGPKVSVIMSFYNESEVLRESVESILNQDYSNIEVICIDDASTDNTLEVLRSYEDRDNFVVVENEQNLGLTKSLNKGIELAEGKYIVRQDADDLSRCTRISEQVNLMEENQAFLCGQYSESAKWIDDEGNLIRGFRETDPPEPEQLENQNILIHSSIIFKNEEMKYREKFRYSQDYDLYLRCLTDSDKELIVKSKDWIVRTYRPDSVGMENRSKQEYCKNKAKDYYLQRKQNADDEYSKDSFKLPKKSDKNYKSNYHRNRMKKALKFGNLDYARSAYSDYADSSSVSLVDKLKYYPILRSRPIYEFAKRVGIRGL
jgi:glycosyltransferase involved in cell wall biosynthesis